MDIEKRASFICIVREPQSDNEVVDFSRRRPFLPAEAATDNFYQPMISSSTRPPTTPIFNKNRALLLDCHNGRLVI